jgi:hypothetical protein
MSFQGGFSVAKYGLFLALGGQPIQQFDGDYMKLDKQYAQIWRVDPKGEKSDDMVAAVHLDKGQYIKKLADG